MPAKVILNFLLFQLAWFACVIGAAKQLPWLGVAVTLVCLAWHFYSAQKKMDECKLLIITLLVGGSFDQLLLSAGLLTYQAHGWSTVVVPVWILALWAIFVTTLNVSLRWMRGRWFIAVMFGLIGGPLAYMGAVRLGAVTLNANPASLVVLAIGWACLTPFLVRLSQRFDGFDHS